MIRFDVKPEFQEVQEKLSGQIHAHCVPGEYYCVLLLYKAYNQ